MFFVGNISWPPTIGFVAAMTANAATSVMTHNCAIFVIVFFLFSFLVLSCSLYYVAGAELDEGKVGTFFNFIANSKMCSRTVPVLRGLDTA